MKIAIILPSLANKGPILVAYDLCVEYIRMGHQCKVFYFDDIVQVEFPCETMRIDFRKKVDLSGFDVVHSHMLRPDAYLVLHGYFRSKLPIVSTVHQHIGRQFRFSDSGKSLLALLKWVWILLLRKFDKVIILNGAQEPFYSRFGLKTTVIHNGRSVDVESDIDDSDRLELEEFASRYTVLGSIAYVTKRKGLDQIIRALVGRPDWGFLLVGEGPETERLRALAVSLQVDDRILFLGSRPDGYRYLKYIDVFVLPSHAEGFPLSLIESFAYGVPAVCSNIEDVSSVLCHDEVAYFELEDIDGLRVAVEYVLQDYDDGCKAVKRLYSEMFSPAVMASRYLDIYREFK